jgi:hypothetical protein
MTTIRDIPFGQYVSLRPGSNKVYLRANVTRNAVPRDRSKTVLVNANTGRVLLIAKDREVYA